MIKRHKRDMTGIITRCYTYRLYPTNTQATALDEMSNAMRRLWNDGVMACREWYAQTGKSPSVYFMLRPWFTAKRNAHEYGLHKYPGKCSQEVARRLQKAYNAFWQKLRQGAHPSCAGEPRFRRYGDTYGIDCPYNGGAGLIERDGRTYLRWMGIGEVRVNKHRDLPLTATPKYLVVSCLNGKWYLSVQFEVSHVAPRHTGPVVGIDLGILTEDGKRRLLTLSTGERVHAPTWWYDQRQRARVMERRIARRAWQSHVKAGRGKLYSQNWKDAKASFANLRAQERERRKDFLHNLSHALTKQYSLIAVEDITPQFMLKNKHLAKSAADAGWSSFLAMLAYKAQTTGTRLVRVNPAYTSQTCSNCGALVEKKLSDRVHICDSCGLEMDRDENAARNILAAALSQLNQDTTA